MNRRLVLSLVLATLTACSWIKQTSTPCPKSRSVRDADGQCVGCLKDSDCASQGSNLVCGSEQVCVAPTPTPTPSPRPTGTPDKLGTNECRTDDDCNRPVDGGDPTELRYCAKQTPREEKSICSTVQELVEFLPELPKPGETRPPRVVMCTSDSDCAAKMPSHLRWRCATSDEGSICEYDQGCAFAPVFFPFGKADVDGRYSEAIRDNARCAATRGWQSLVVEAHCDKVGSLQVNQQLSERRAMNLAAALKGQYEALRPGQMPALGAEAVGQGRRCLQPGKSDDEQRRGLVLEIGKSDCRT